MALKKSEENQQNNIPQATMKTTQNTLLKKLLALDENATASLFTITHENMKGYEICTTLQGAKVTIVALDTAINKALMHD